MHQASRNRSRRQFLLIAAAFLMPLLLAVWMYYGGYGQVAPRGSQNGILLDPIVHLPDVVDEPDIVALAEQGWTMLYANNGECLQDCRDALYKLRQARLMLGNDMSRMQRLFLHGESVPDKVFLQQQHAGLTSMTDKTLGGVLNGKRPEESAAGGIYLIDPLGNLVMYFPPELNPREMVDDIKHLLDLSRIG